LITCRDVEISASWYQRVLGMEREEFGPHRRTSLRFGGQKINLRPVTATQEEWFTGAAGGVPGTDDLCFVVTMKAEQVAEYLKACGVTVEVGPVAKAGALGPIMSCYCRDPDGNLIEIASYSG
jgi:catechol 2,3-dioxygenase-like lactoylglutathione lyase family enzyme